MKATVKILNKEFQVNAPNGTEERLLEAAHYLNQQLRAIRESGRVIGLERMAIMAALNISHELLQLRTEQATEHQALNRKIQYLQNQIEGALIEEADLEAQSF